CVQQTRHCSLECLSLNAACAWIRSEQSGCKCPAGIWAGISILLIELVQQGYEHALSSLICRHLVQRPGSLSWDKYAVLPAQQDFLSLWAVIILEELQLAQFRIGFIFLFRFCRREIHPCAH